MTWNHRVVRRVYDRKIGGQRVREVGYAIHEAFYERRKDTVPGTITQTPVDPHGQTLEELRHVLVQMLKATYDPVLNYGAIGRNKKPQGTRSRKWRR